MRYEYVATVKDGAGNDRSSLERALEHVGGGELRVRQGEAPGTLTVRFVIPAESEREALERGEQAMVTTYPRGFEQAVTISVDRT